MNVVFLDVDGVLNSMAYFEKIKNDSVSSVRDDISDYHLQMLAKICHTCDAKIVLSSTWRELDDKSCPVCYEMYSYLVSSLKKYGMEIYDKTPVVQMNRPLEIKTWLDNQTNKNSICFVSLDDDFGADEYEQYGIGSCLIRTRFFCKKERDGGLQPEHVHKAIEILGEKNDTNTVRTV